MRNSKWRTVIFGGRGQIDGDAILFAPWASNYRDPRAIVTCFVNRIIFYRNLLSNQRNAALIPEQLIDRDRGCRRPLLFLKNRRPLCPKFDTRAVLHFFFAGPPLRISAAVNLPVPVPVLQVG